MAAKVHKSLRLDNGLVERVESLKREDEPFSNAVERVLTVGCDALERGTVCNTKEHGENTPKDGVPQLEHDESTQKLIDRLEADIARLEAEHEADRAAIADKDAQIAAALTKAHDLAEQAHVLTGRAQEVKQLPKADEGGEVLDVTPAPEKIGFWDWWRNYR